MEVNDFVRILAIPETDINAKARVIRVGKAGVWVANMNQPFQGTFFNEYFTFESVEKL